MVEDKIIKKYSCSMDGCDEETNSGLFKIDEKKSYIIPLCDEHFLELVALKQSSDKKILMIIDYNKLPRIEIFEAIGKG